MSELCFVDALTAVQALWCSLAEVFPLTSLIAGFPPVTSFERQCPSSVCSGILLYLAKCLHNRLMSSPPTLPPPPASLFFKTRAAFTLAWPTWQVVSFPRGQVQQQCNINSQVMNTALPCPQLCQFGGLQQHHTMHFFRKGSGVWEGGSLWDSPVRTVLGTPYETVCSSN